MLPRATPHFWQHVSNHEECVVHLCKVDLYCAEQGSVTLMHACWGLSWWKEYEAMEAIVVANILPFSIELALSNSLQWK
jgi:hypothetical protein